MKFLILFFTLSLTLQIKLINHKKDDKYMVALQIIREISLKYLIELIDNKGQVREYCLKTLEDNGNKQIVFDFIDNLMDNYTYSIQHKSEKPIFSLENYTKLLGAYFYNKCTVNGSTYTCGEQLDVSNINQKDIDDLITPYLKILIKNIPISKKVNIPILTGLTNRERHSEESKFTLFRTNLLSPLLNK